MGGDENRIEIIIDAAETKSAAKSATEANQRLSEFRKALDAFKNGVGDLNKTIETNTTTVANFNTFLKDFSTKLNDNLSRMQESVIKDFEPRLEKNLENMVARAINKVEAKTSAPGKESRSRSEPKAGAGAPVNNVATVAQPKGYESPDAIMRETIDSVRKRIIDPLTGAVQEATTQKTKTTTTRVERFQEEREDGEIVNVERKINDVVHSVSKIGSITDALNKTKFTDNPVEQYLEDINKKWKSTDPDLPDFAGSISDAIEKSTASHTWASPMDQFSKTMQKPIENIYGSGTGYGKPVKEKGEKKSNNWADPSNMMRREITGALIALHVMKVVAGNSQVAASGFAMVSNAIGHLLNIVLIPMIPIFSMFAQLIHQVANVINSMPYGIRLLIGGLVMWKATSALIASMPIREFGSGIEQLKENLKGGSDTLNKFGEVVKALINFMNSGLRGGRVQGLAEWVGGKIRGKRAGGGPVGKSNAYVVGEKGPELFVPDSSGTIVPNSAFREDGGGVTPGGGLPFGDILGNLGAGLGAGGLTYLLTGSPLLAGGVGAGAAMLGPAGIAQAMSGIISSEIGQQVIGSLNVLTGTISSLFAPLAPIFGILSVALGVVTGLKGGGGGGDKGAETTAKVGNAINSTVSRGNFGIQSVINTGNMGTNKLISMILVRLAGCLRVAPCDGANFGGAETTVIAGLLPTILASIIAIPQGINTKLGEFITNATVKIKSIWEPIPQPEALADRTAKVVYNIETVGEKPVVVDTAAKIRYNIETVGSAPVAQDATAKIKYNIETIGTAPVATDISARARYTIETIGEIPTIKNAAAKITYTVETIGNLPVIKNITSWIDVKINELTESEYQKLKETVEVKGAANPPKITAKLLADGTIEGGVPTIDVTTKAKTLDVTGLTPAQKTVDGVTATVESANVDAVKGLEVPAKGIVEGLSGTDIIEISPGNYAYKNALDIPTKAKLGLVTPEEYTAYLEDLAAKAKANPPKISTTLTTDGKVTTSDGLPLKAEVPTTVNVVKGKYGSWEVLSDGSVKYIGNTIEIPTEMGDPKPIDPTKLEPIKVEVKPEVPAGTDPLTGINWGDIGKSAGALVGVGIFAALDEFARTGTVNWLPLTASLTTAFVLWTGAETALTGIATSLGGAAAGTAVGAAMSTVGTALIAAMLVPIATMFAGDFYRGIAEAVNQGSFTPGVFDNFALKAAAELGASFGKWLNDWFDKNLNIDLSGAIRKIAQGENGWLIDLMQGGVASVISLTLGPTAGMAFNKFIDDMQRTLSGGIPVDVKFDVESLTNVVRETAGGTPISGGIPDPAKPAQECPSGQYWDRALQRCATPAGNVIPSHAFGGYVTPGVPNLVGERGPEMFVPMTGGKIIPNGDLRGGGGGGGSSVTNNFTFNVTTNNPKELTDTVMRELKMELARVKM